jgi:cytosine/creatinine deaminase
MGTSRDDLRYMAVALAEARSGREEGGVPIGACLVSEDDAILGRGHNQRVQLRSPILHAEMAALQHAGRLPPEQYRRCTMYTTLSPCSMCTGAILLFGIPRVVLAENTTFLGAEDLLRHNGVEVVDLDLEEAKALMREFQQKHPGLWREDIGRPE